VNQGVELLLQRMDSHPEEFNTHNPDKRVREKWHWVTGPIKTRMDFMNRNPDDDPVMHFESLGFLTDREILMLHDKYMSIQGDSFSRRVMATLLTDGEA
jgi:hypothetical protein